MKKKSILFTAFAAFVYLATSSYSGGPALNGAGDKTGSPNASGTCGNVGCHSGGGGTTTASIELRKKSWGASSTPVNYYEAGETYIVTLKGNNALLDTFGFQLTTLRNSDNAVVGNYDNLAPNTHVAPSTSTPNFVEHSTPIGKNANNEFEISFDWIAPTAMEGDITMYGIVNAVNKNSSSLGDNPSPTAQLQLRDATSIIEVEKVASVNVYPNPVADVLQLDIQNAEAGIYSIKVYNSAGAIVQSTDVSLHASSAIVPVNMSGVAQGMYFVHLNHTKLSQVIPVLKQ